LIVVVVSRDLPCLLTKSFFREKVLFVERSKEAILLLLVRRTFFHIKRTRFAKDSEKVIVWEP